MRAHAVKALVALGSGERDKLALELKALEGVADRDFSGKPLKQAATRAVSKAIARMGTARR